MDVKIDKIDMDILWRLNAGTSGSYVSEYKLKEEVETEDFNERIEKIKKYKFLTCDYYPETHPVFAGEPRKIQITDLGTEYVEKYQSSVYFEDEVTYILNKYGCELKEGINHREGIATFTIYKKGRMNSREDSIIIPLNIDAEELEELIIDNLREK